MEHQRRNLEADRFSRAGGHYAETVLPGENVVDYIALTGAEFAVSEILFQNLVFTHVCLSKTKGGSFRLTAL